MNIKSLVMVASFASVLAATMVLPQTLIQVNNNNSYSQPEQVQSANISSSTISIDAADLEQPHILSVSIPRGYLEGKIELNGRVLSQLTDRDRDTRIDLSPHLSRGRNVIKISGTYNPERAKVTVELAGSQSQVTQQTAGNGKLNQIIILEVQ